MRHHKGQRPSPAAFSQNGRRWLVVTLILTLLLTLAGCQTMQDMLFPERAELRYEKEAYRKMMQRTTPRPTPTQPEPLIKGPPPEKKRPTVTLLATGDVLMHQPILNAAQQPDGNFEFGYSYRYIQDYVKYVDWATFNMEGTLAGEPYSGYPIFSAPDVVATTLRDVGFDMAYAANNHAMDREIEGLKRTVKVLNDNDIEVVGTRREEGPGYIIKNLNGMKIGFVNYTYETSVIDGMRSLNGIPIPEDDKHLIDSFNIEDRALMEADMKDMSERIKAMREDGAEFIVFYIHWGTEYQIVPDQIQIEMSEFLTREGVDLIIGAGPHVIQEVRYLHQPHGGRTLCYYSLGNFVSNQQFDTADNGGFAEDGIVALVRLEKADGQVYIKDAGYLPTYCFKLHPQEDYTFATILPLHAAMEDPEAFQFEGGTELLEMSLERVKQVMLTNSKEVQLVTKLSDFFTAEDIEQANADAEPEPEPGEVEDEAEDADAETPEAESPEDGEEDAAEKDAGDNE